ncbi:MAG: DnaJ family domain-containing protein [Planctomycetota bacterium]
MDPLHDVIERRIREAEEAGLFRGLPGEGKPLELEDLTRVPEDLRGGYILLKNAGVLPEELELRQSLLRLDDLISACESEGERERLSRERAVGALRLAMLRERRGFGPAHEEYAARLAERLGG